MISSLIKQIMAATGLKQSGLADLLGVPLDRVKSLASGKVAKLSPDEMRALVEKLRVRPEFLATGEGAVLRTTDDEQFERRLQKLRDVTAAATAVELPVEYQQLVRDIMMGVALRDDAIVRGAIDAFVAVRVSAAAAAGKKPTKGKGRK